MTKKITVAISPLTGTIYAGRILKTPGLWGADRTDVTMDALVAVCEHVIARKEGDGDAYMSLTNVNTGKIEYEITVKKHLVDDEVQP